MAYSNVAKAMKEAARDLFPGDKQGRRAFLRLPMPQKQQVVQMRARVHGHACYRCEDTGVVVRLNEFGDELCYSCDCAIGRQTWVTP